ncbi:MAG: hypothetical protein AB7O49_01050 [Sphingomonadales bacterium]
MFAKNLGKGNPVWLKRAAIGAASLGMIGMAACGGNSGGAYYSDGYYGGTGVYYYEADRPSRHHHRYHRHDDRGYYDRHGHWRRY